MKRQIKDEMVSMKDLTSMILKSQKLWNKEGRTRESGRVRYSKKDKETFSTLTGVRDKL